jgi:proteasome lid subunit RPN8/RPN11
MPDSHILWISHHLAEKIREHGAETYPHECCGALLGRDAAFERNLVGGENKFEAPREVLKLFPLSNRNGDSPRNRFMVTADDVRTAELAARNEHLEIIGWYHSHPDHPARPSDFDRDHAWPWYSYIIVSVQQGKGCEMTSWRLNDDRQAFSPEGVEVRHSTLV